MGLLDTYTARDYTPQVTITHRLVSQSRCLVTASNGGRSSASGLTSSQANEESYLLGYNAV
jgi:hypothetical protein